jgi:putative ABC transport system ATP-binding protein
VALAGNPKIVLADEPTAEVDAETENRVLELLDNYCRGGGALVVATHSSAIAKRASRTIRLLDGKIVNDD